MTILVKSKTRLRSVYIEFESGVRMHVAAKTDKPSLRFEVTDATGLSTQLTGLIGHSIRPLDYHIDLENKVIHVGDRRVTKFEKTWYDHSECFALDQSEVENFLGRKVEDFIVLDVQLIQDDHSPK